MRRNDVCRMWRCGAIGYPGDAVVGEVGVLRASMVRDSGSHPAMNEDVRRRDRLECEWNGPDRIWKRKAGLPILSF